MLKDKMSDILFENTDYEENMGYSVKLEEAKISEAFRQHLLQNNFDQHVVLVDKITKLKFLEREIDHDDDRRDARSPTVVIPKCPVSPSAKRDSLFRYKFNKKMRKISKIIHPSDFGDANIIYYNKNLVHDKNMSYSEGSNTDYIFDESSDSMYSIKLNANNTELSSPCIYY